MWNVHGSPARVSRVFCTTETSANGRPPVRVCPGQSGEVRVTRVSRWKVRAYIFQQTNAETRRKRMNPRNRSFSDSTVVVGGRCCLHSSRIDNIGCGRHVRLFHSKPSICTVHSHFVRTPRRFSSVPGLIVFSSVASPSLRTFSRPLPPGALPALSRSRGPPSAHVQGRPVFRLFVRTFTMAGFVSIGSASVLRPRWRHVTSGSFRDQIYFPIKPLSRYFFVRIRWRDKRRNSWCLGTFVPRARVARPNLTIRARRAPKSRENGSITVRHGDSEMATRRSVFPVPRFTHCHRERPMCPTAENRRCSIAIRTTRDVNRKGCGFYNSIFRIYEKK